MNKFFRSWQLIALSVAILACLSSCKDDDPVTPLSEGGVLIGTRVPNPDGVTGAAYIQLIKDISPATYDNKQAFEAAYSAPPVVKGNEIYVLPGWREASSQMKIYAPEDGKLVKKGEIDLPANSGANGLEVVGNKIYVSYSLMGKIAVIDKSQLTVTKLIDLQGYAVGDKNPEPAQMIERDGILYVGLNQLQNGKPMPSPMRPMADVLLIDIDKDEPIKMITADFANMSMPTKPEADAYSIFKDENDDIYINCISGFGFLRLDAGFLRIKKGETEFDKSYAFKITQTAIEGEPNKASYVMVTRYAGNGIVYATVDIPAYYSAKPNWAEDRTVLPVKIDLKAKTIKRLGEVRSCNYGFSVDFYQDKVLFGLSTKTDNGFFVYDTKTDKMSDGAVIKTTGNPMCLLEIK